MTYSAVLYITEVKYLDNNDNGVLRDEYNDIVERYRRLPLGAYSPVPLRAPFAGTTTCPHEALCAPSRGIDCASIYAPHAKICAYQALLRLRPAMRFHVPNTSAHYASPLHLQPQPLIPSRTLLRPCGVQLK